MKPGVAGCGHGRHSRGSRVSRRSDQTWLRQQDVADSAGVSQSQMSLIERGHIRRSSVDSLRRVAAVLDIRIDIVARWRGGDRLLNSRHSSLGNAVASWLHRLGWEVAPEVSFAISGERGWIDLLAWHAPTRTPLVIELKTEIVDLQDLLGVVDRKTRLAARIAHDRGWIAATVATWVVVAEGPTNRRRVTAHQALLRTALPDDGRAMRRWLRSPSGRVAALSFFSSMTRGDPKSDSPAESGSGGSSQPEAERDDAACSVAGRRIRRLALRGVLYENDQSVYTRYRHRDCCLIEDWRRP